MPRNKTLETNDYTLARAHSLIHGLEWWDTHRPTPPDGDKRYPTRYWVGNMTVEMEEDEELSEWEQLR